MTDLKALDALIEAVDRGEFHRGPGMPARYIDMIDAGIRIGLKCSRVDLADSLHAGQGSCADFLRAYRAQIGGDA